MKFGTCLWTSLGAGVVVGALSGCGDSNTSALPPTTATTTFTDGPEATSAADGSTPPGATPGPVLPETDNTRGFLSGISYWDRTFTPATQADCVNAGYVNGLNGNDRAWRLPGGALVCAPDPSVGAWGGRTENLDIYFEPTVDEQTALAAIASIMPADNTQVQVVNGSNADYSKKPTGSCRHVVYASDALATVSRAANPTWPGDPQKADATLYTGDATSSDGSDRAYTPGAVHTVLIGVADTGDIATQAC